MALTKPSDKMLAPGSGTTQAATATTASGTNAAITGLPAGTQYVRVTFVGLSSASANNRPAMQIGPSGGYASSGYAGNTGQVNSTPGSNTAAVNSAYFDFMSGGWAAATTYSGVIELFLHDAATNTWVVRSTTHALETQTYVYHCVGSVALSGALDRVKLYEATGGNSYDAGTVNFSYR